MIIKVITLWEPWASLMVMGEKTIETRPRNTSYKGELYIHSSKFKDKRIEELCNTYPFNLFIKDYNALPFGMITGRINVVGSARTEWIKQHHASLKLDQDWDIEKEFGDYTAGRYGILTRLPKKLLTPIEARGQQIIPWEFNVTEDLLKVAA